MTRRYILGTVKRPSGFRCKVTDAAVLAAWAEHGDIDEDGNPLGLTEAAAAVGLARTTIWYRLRVLRVLPQSQGTVNNPRPPTVERPCLKCDRGFASTGRGNRLCPVCRGQSDPMPGFVSEAWV